ncbi:MAG: hypothetical protein JSV04_14080 [Candidatus Heimdallarchaeota archaeon]|nr:MAG: hypothetical protein JSV04_14080 [Candidatus Heimdallarchaeota archaeon]
MKVKIVIWSIQLFMIFGFLFFSILPLITIISTFFSLFISYFWEIRNFILLLLIFSGLISIYGIITLDLRLRTFTTIIFSGGILYSFENPYLLTLGVILTWLFYEIWFICNKYHLLDSEYRTYPISCIEKQRLEKSLFNQLSSFGLLGWIVLLISWAVIFTANNFYIDLGEYGTVGISLSVAMILLLYLTKNFIRLPSRQSQ